MGFMGFVTIGFNLFARKEGKIKCSVKPSRYNLQFAGFPGRSSIISWPINLVINSYPTEVKLRIWRQFPVTTFSGYIINRWIKKLGYWFLMKRWNYGIWIMPDNNNPLTCTCRQIFKKVKKSDIGKYFPQQKIVFLLIKSFFNPTTTEIFGRWWYWGGERGSMWPTPCKSHLRRGMELNFGT